MANDTKMVVAVPCDGPGGLQATVSEHFGHCAAFTLVTVDDGKTGEVEVLENAGHEQGGCMAPVLFLKGHDVDVLIAGGMGGRPLAGFQEVGISVHFKEQAATVAEAVDLFLRGECREFGAAQTCGGGGGGCEGHHQHQVERPAIEGPADIRNGRVVTIDFVLKDGAGERLESSEGSGPLRYLHGSGTVLPALEAGLEGLSEGDRKDVEISCEKGFGEPDEERIIEVERSQLPPDAEVGMMLSGRGPDGQPIGFKVMELGEDKARLDGNHPFAGKDLAFHITVVKVEAATPEELSSGHVH